MRNIIVLAEDVVFQVGGLNDAPGFQITIDASGHVHIKKIPGGPGDPDGLKVVQAAVSLYAAATRVASGVERAEMERTAMTLLNTSAAKKTLDQLTAGELASV